MKKFFTLFFVTLGVIFFIIILIGVYLFVFDPFHIKPLFTNTPARTISTATSSKSDLVTGSEISDKNSALSSSQEKALETFGIDPASVPTSITPEQEACFTEILGTTRVSEIKAGDSPTATEFFKAKSCL